MSPPSPPTTHWLRNSESLSEIDSLCVGTGRFLRSVLVPILVQSNFRVALIQTRGTSFVEFMHQQQGGDGTYPIDTVWSNGHVETTNVSIDGVFSWGVGTAGKHMFYDCLPQMKRPPVFIGVGVTEAGLANASTQAMLDLYELLTKIQELIASGTWQMPRKKLSILDMDNLPNNGSLLRQHMHTQADSAMKQFLKDHVEFHDTMVDRITSARDNNPMIPRCEPIPAKALVVLDEQGILPLTPAHSLGLVIRKSRRELEIDTALKLRIANGTHTAIAHLLAVMGVTHTDRLARNDEVADTLMAYLDALVNDQIVAAGVVAQALPPHSVEALDAYADWRKRLTHAHFGLISYFITQNGPAKGGIRLGPTVVDLVAQQKPLTICMAFAFAVLLRWLTPRPNLEPKDGIFTGWIQGFDPQQPKVENQPMEYADKLRYDLTEGWYEFRCTCTVIDDTRPRNLAEWLQSCETNEYENVVRAYLIATEGGNLRSLANEKPIGSFVKVVAALFARMVAGEDPASVLQAMRKEGSLSMTATE